MSEDNNHIIDDLLVKYLLGEASADESREAGLWISASDDNRKHFAGLKLIWEESRRVSANSNPDEDAAWSRLQNRIAKTDTQTVPQIIPAANKFGWLRIAASILVICVSCYFIYDRLIGMSTVSNDTASALVKELPDGSTVTLNNHSQLTYPNHFRGDTRSVQLNGEGFFNITHDKTKPFIIKIKTVTVSVVGTSFNVKNVNNQTEVIVVTGIVKVNANGTQALLHPGEKATAIEKTAGMVVQRNQGSLYNYYITRSFVCDGTPLHELTDKMNQVYGTHIKIEGSQVRNLPITATFKGQSPDQILNIVAETFKIKVERRQNQVILK